MLVGLAALLAQAVGGPALVTHTVAIAPGVHMPAVSNGAVVTREDRAETEAMALWFARGGRGVDTAWNYNNQQVVGYALANTTAAVRAELFVTTKIPCVGSKALALQYIQQDLAQLGVRQVDLLLIHSMGYGEPAIGNPGSVGCWGHRPCCGSEADLLATWAGLEEALARNYTRAIGVSNACVDRAIYAAHVPPSAHMHRNSCWWLVGRRTSHINALASGAEVMPAVNQCQMYVGSHDGAAIQRCKELNITYEAYSPLGP